MLIHELYSMRNKPKYPDVYQYDYASSKLRNQIIQVAAETIGGYKKYVGESPAQQVYQAMFGIMRKSYGQKTLAGCDKGSFSWFEHYLTTCTDGEKHIDVIELLCQMIDTMVRAAEHEHQYYEQVITPPDDAIAEINEWMKRDGFGYEYSNRQLIRVDNQFIHAEVVKPALYILQDFDGAREEFLSAHEHYRHGAYEECIADCNKSFESLMKGICHERGWDYDHTAQAKKLIKTCLDNELIPTYLQEQFAQYLNLLSSGIPTIRNKEAGHGQGHEVKDPAQSLTSYALHLTASNLVFLGECNKTLR